MKNNLFDITIDESNGLITSIANPNDINQMNWCKEDGLWGRLHDTNHEFMTEAQKEYEKLMCRKSDNRYKFVSYKNDDNSSQTIYTNDRISITITRHFIENGNLVENYRIKNITDTVLCITRDTFGIEVPFNDRYTYADECLTRRCHTHIWCGHNVAWVNALRMGESDYNLGLFLTKGEIDCYSQIGCTGNDRGLFILGFNSIMLKSGQEYEIEWELFWHKGKDNFLDKISCYSNYIGINADYYTIFEGENIFASIKANNNENLSAYFGEEEIITEFKDGYFTINYTPKNRGEHRLKICSGDITTYADFLVKKPFEDLLKDRVNFIVNNQQCLDKESPLYGAYLVYDNETESQYFDFFITDHNACRERMNLPLLIIKYLQKYDDKKIRASLDLYVAFMFREFYDQDTGEVFNNIGKNRNVVRLYNNPGVMLILTELYYLTKNKKYLLEVVRLAKNYYGIDGKKCYSNAVAVEKVMNALKQSEMIEEYNIMLDFFKSHAQNIISNDLSYPKHEVNYEQTIVTPAVMIVSEVGMLVEDKNYYKKEAKKHIACLERFSGNQPSFHLNEIAIRFWDDFWFGKNHMFGDTLPHHLSCLTARAYLSYHKLTNENEWLLRAEECIRNCMCLISDDGHGSAAYVFPYKLDAKRGEFYDPWSNDQDLILYDALYLKDYINI